MADDANSQSGTFLARAFVDADDRLVAADEPLFGLQARLGGAVPGPLLVPALLQLVRKARHAGLRLARPLELQDLDATISTWVEVRPETGGGGCAIGITDWETGAAVEPRAKDRRLGRLVLDRQVAALSARLDSNQCLLGAIAGGGGELAGLAERMQAGRGRSWADFVDVEGLDAGARLHWRLLDGARLQVDGQEGAYRAALEPIGNANAGGHGGFELLLVPDGPLAENRDGGTGRQERFGRMQATVGREIAPVLRPSIARIIANAETIRTKMAGPLADDYADYAADIAAAGQHLLSLVEDLADLEVVEAESFSTAPDEIDLVDVARRAIGILGVRARSKGISLIAPEEGQSAPATAEFRRVLQVMLNLVGNAIRYSPDDAAIDLTFDRAGDFARVTVADQGPGLSAEQQDKIFAKFERLGRSGDGGSGLGLYISRRLAEAMGGSLSVESAPGEGARFTLVVPAREG